MKRSFFAGLLGLGISGVAPFATNAAPLLPSVDVWADGSHYSIPIEQTQGADTWEVGGETGYQMNVPGEFSLSITGLIDPDPQIDFGFTITDFGAPTTFTFGFTTPIILGAGPNIVYGSISGGLNDVTNNGASITPALPDSDGDLLPELQVNTVDNGGPETNMGVDVGLGMTLAPGGLPGTQTYGPFNSLYQAGPSGVWTNLNSTVKFLASGGGDIFSATGHAEINEGTVIPEPATFGLLAVAGIGTMIRRRRSA